MGIKGLNKFLEKKCKNGIKKENFNNLKGKYIGIDTSIFLYKYTYMGNMVQHFLKQIEHLLSFDITPVYLFDGKPTEDKSLTMNKRKETTKTNDEKILLLKEEITKIEKNDDITDEEMKVLIEDLNIEIKKKVKNNIRINREEVQKFKEILKNLDIFYYECQGETDSFIKSFFTNKLIDYVITEDLDFLTHGCNYVISKYNYNSNVFNLYDFSVILKELEFEYESFINFCVILGCDYYPKGIKNIGPVNGYKLIKKHLNIENILCNNDINIEEDFNYKHILSLFRDEKEINVCKLDLEINKRKINHPYFKEDFKYNIKNVMLKMKKFKIQQNILNFLR